MTATPISLCGKGHIDRCIRLAAECGLEPETAIRMATLSAAERFGLTDRGALAPGRRADLCIVSNLRPFTVQENDLLRHFRETPAP